jgi:hypothetical protein
MPHSRLSYTRNVYAAFDHLTLILIKAPLDCFHEGNTEEENNGYVVFECYIHGLAGK